MSRFRKVDVRVWCDSKVCGLSHTAQLIWLRLLTGPETTNIPGLIPIGRAALAEAMNLDPDVFTKGFGELLANGMVRADWKARLVWLPNAGKYNMPENPNVIKGWKPTWDIIPECSLKYESLQSLKSLVEGLPKGFQDAFGLGSDKTMPNQEQEQEQEQDKDVPPPSAGKPSRSPSWKSSYPEAVVDCASRIMETWPNPRKAHVQPGARETTLVPTSSAPELAQNLDAIRRQGGDLEICEIISARVVQEWRDGKWIKAAQHFFGKAKDAPWKAYYQAHVTNQGMEVGAA